MNNTNETQLQTNNTKIATAIEVVKNLPSMPNEKAKSGEITVTGFNSTLTINHGLGVKPKMFVMVTTNQSPVDSYTNCYYYPIKVGGTIGMPMRNYQYTGTDTPTITENNITIHSVNNFNFAQTTYHWFAIA